jgi:catechol 2,3-dioxygenase
LDLARVLRRLLERDVSLQGTADHGVGEALHLADLEGNGPEVCADRTPEEGPYREEALDMHTRPPDIGRLMGSTART